MRQIKLASGDEVLVDDEDYEFLSRWKWKLHPQGYASRNSWQGDKYVTLLMHRVICQPLPGQEVDHRNGNKLDNRRLNLRSVDHSINQLNNGPQSNNSSGYRGISWSKSRQKWEVRVYRNGKSAYNKRFGSLSEAIDARRDVLRKLGV